MRQESLSQQPSNILYQDRDILPVNGGIVTKCGLRSEMRKYFYFRWRRYFISQKNLLITIWKWGGVDMNQDNRPNLVMDQKFSCLSGWEYFQWHLSVISRQIEERYKLWITELSSSLNKSPAPARLSTSKLFSPLSPESSHFNTSTQNTERLLV